MSMFLPPRSTKSESQALESKVLPLQLCSEHLRILQYAASTENIPKPISSRGLSSRAANCPEVLAPSQVHGLHCCSWWDRKVSRNQTSVFITPLLLGSWEMIPPSFLCPPADTRPPPGPFLSLRGSGSTGKGEDRWGPVRGFQILTPDLEPYKGKGVRLGGPCSHQEGIGFSQGCWLPPKTGWNTQGHSACSASTCGRWSKVTVVAGLIYKLDWESQEDWNYDLCELLLSCMSSFRIWSSVTFY